MAILPPSKLECCEMLTYWGQDTTITCRVTDIGNARAKRVGGSLGQTMVGMFGEGIFDPTTPHHLYPSNLGLYVTIACCPERYHSRHAARNSRTRIALP